MQLAGTKMSRIHGYSLRNHALNSLSSHPYQQSITSTGRKMMWKMKMTTRTFSFVISRRVLPSLAPPARPIRSCLATGAVAPLSWSLTLMTLMTSRAQVLTPTPVFFNTTHRPPGLDERRSTTSSMEAAMGRVPTNRNS